MDPPPLVLFVVAEGGAARFFLPLWRRWVHAPPDFSWKVILGDGANRLLRREGDFANFPVSLRINRWDDGIERHLEALSPALLLASAGDGYPIEKHAVSYTRRKGGRTAQAIDTWYNYRRRFAGVSVQDLPDSILVIDETAREEAMKEGLPKSRLVAVGHPWWESAPRWRPGPPNHVMFLGAPVRRDYERRLGFDETDAWKLVLSASEQRPDLFDRIWYAKHPEQGDLTLGNSSAFRFEPDAMARLPEAGAVIGIFSGPMVDAFLSGTRVISVQPHPVGQDMCPLSRHGFVPRATTVDELVAALAGGRTSPRGLVNQLVGSTDRLEAFVYRQLIR